MATAKRERIRADDFVAESLEKIVKGLPPSKKHEADYLLGVANRLRESESKRVIWRLKS